MYVVMYAVSRSFLVGHSGCLSVCLSVCVLPLLALYKGLAVDIFKMFGSYCFCCMCKYLYFGNGVLW